MSPNVGGIDYAVAIIPFDLEPPDCDPFYHGYEMKCSEAMLTIRIWKLPLVDLYGTHFKLKFYLVEGDGYLLVGNKIASKCQIRNDENLLIIPEGNEGISMEKMVNSTYLSHDHRT